MNATKKIDGSRKAWSRHLVGNYIAANVDGVGRIGLFYERKGGYFYWWGDMAQTFKTTIVGGVSHLRALTLDDYLADFRAKMEEAGL